MEDNIKIILKENFKKNDDNSFSLKRKDNIFIYKPYNENQTCDEVKNKFSETNDKYNGLKTILSINFD